jgi:hypothetical protein
MFLITQNLTLNPRNLCRMEKFGESFKRLVEKKKRKAKGKRIMIY